MRSSRPHAELSSKGHVACAKSIRTSPLAPGRLRDAGLSHGGDTRRRNRPTDAATVAGCARRAAPRPAAPSAPVTAAPPTDDPIAPDLLYCPGGGAFSFALTPGYQWKYFLARAEFRWVKVNSVVAGFGLGPNLNRNLVYRVMIETAILFSRGPRPPRFL
jgi:hypothetical protein